MIIWRLADFTENPQVSRWAAVGLKKLKMSLGHPTDILLTEKAFMLRVLDSVMSFYNCFFSFAFHVKSFTFLGQ